MHPHIELCSFAIFGNFEVNKNCHFCGNLSYFSIISLLFRLMFEVSSRHAMAYVDHNNGTKVVEASTTEFCISRYLYKTSDVAAAYNVGRVLASRCKETGLYRVMWQHKRDRSHKKVWSFFM